MAANAAFKIYYPSSVVITSLSTCQIVYNLQTYNPNVCSLDTTNQVISIYGNFAVAVPAGATVAINFGPVTNPQTTNKLVLGNFGIQTYTSSYTYKIDAIMSGPQPALECDYTCKTCVGTSATQRK